MIHLVCPTLDLLVYHLKDGVGETKDKVQENYQHFLVNVPHNLPESLSQNAVTEDTEYVQFLDLNNYSKGIFKFRGILDEYEVDGSYQRFCVEDTYGLLFDVSVEGKFSARDLARCLGRIQFLAPEYFLLPGKLGQTWMISGVIENSNEDELQVLADKVYITLIEEGWQYQEIGQFLGGTVLELWRSSSQGWETVQNDSQMLIFVYPNQKAIAKAAEFSEYWNHLFCYRHKIISAYSQSREITKRLLDEFNQIFPTITSLDELEYKKLNSILHNNLARLSNFVKNLNRLEQQKQIIECNIHSYDKSLEMMIKKAGESGNNFNFLKQFSKKVKEKYQKQIEKDSESIRPCLEMLENLTATIRGTVEISKAESDRAFQKDVYVVGIGLATATIVATSSATIAEDIAASSLIHKSLSLQPKDWRVQLGTTLSFSMIAGVSASLIVMLFLGLLGKRKR